MISAFLAVAQLAASSSNYYEFIEKSDLVNFVDAVHSKRRSKTIFGFADAEACSDAQNACQSSQAL